MSSKIKTMTDSELTAAATAYDRIHNEGGEGYNPYRNEIDCRAAAAPASANPKDQIDRLQHRIRVECGSVARETEGNEIVDAREDGIRSQIAELQAQIDADFAAVWTVELTTERRERYNEIARLKMADKITGIEFRRRVDALEYSIDDLRKAIKINNL